jgi:hypothetical protein
MAWITFPTGTCSSMVLRKREFYRVAFRKKIYQTIDELQIDLDVWVTVYNENSPASGMMVLWKTPMQTFLDALPIAREKLLPAA